MPDLFVAQKQTQNKEESAAPEPDIPVLKQKIKHHPHMFSSFCENPIHLSFQSQEEDEKIILFLRRHFITNFLWIFLSIILLFLPLATMVIAPFFDLDLSFIPKGLTTISTFFYYLALFSYVLINFMAWAYNIFIITEKRVIDIDYSNTVIHNVAETKMSHIQDVNYTQVGFISSVFNFGDVFVQTAGNEVNFEALSVPQPRKVAKIVADFIGKEA